MRCAHMCFTIVSILIFTTLVFAADKDKEKLQKALQKASKKNEEHAADQKKWENRQEKSHFPPKRFIARKMAEMHNNKRVEHAMKYFKADGAIKDIEQQSSSSHNVAHNHQA
ncbi:uncharacterized protein FA14DRAFT_161918 [Meira miltonrushii]|uniref:Uncharacterized protein n=1 Tax=Meira miltonrushii TaxID=1280837 RepID=A0A316V4P1_9BASI|nr:uncharacterized protein FA14DRAFT_161918 [Meira miltonrushii]PWN32517.1 hypothetical protein FA14DRAFT_161918 [Meira miltonrushii]